MYFFQLRIVVQNIFLTIAIKRCLKRIAISITSSLHCKPPTKDECVVKDKSSDSAHVTCIAVAG